MKKSAIPSYVIKRMAKYQNAKARKYIKRKGRLKKLKKKYKNNALRRQKDAKKEIIQRLAIAIKKQGSKKKRSRKKYSKTRSKKKRGRKKTKTRSKRKSKRRSKRRKRRRTI